MFGVGRASLGLLSESVSIFDPEPLKQIAATLAIEVPSADPSKFDAIEHQLTAVDGSFFVTAVRVAFLARLPSKGNGTTKGTAVDGYRMHTHFEILRGILERIDTTPAKPKGKDDETSVLASALQPDRCYVTDRGYAKFELFDLIHAIGSKASNCDRRLRLVTNLIDVPAELIAEAYRHCWLIKFFFRMIKQLLGCRHPLSTRPISKN